MKKILGLLATALIAAMLGPATPAVAATLVGAPVACNWSGQILDIFDNAGRCNRLLDSGLTVRDPGAEWRIGASASNYPLWEIDVGADRVRLYGVDKLAGPWGYAPAYQTLWIWIGGLTGVTGVSLASTNMTSFVEGSDRNYWLFNEGLGSFPAPTLQLDLSRAGFWGPGKYVEIAFTFAPTTEPGTVPEPGTAALMLVGLAGLALTRRRKH